MKDLPARECKIFVVTRRAEVQMKLIRGVLISDSD